jgi:hypothetical protein
MCFAPPDSGQRTGWESAAEDNDATARRGQDAALEGLKEFVRSRTGNECYAGLGYSGRWGWNHDKQLDCSSMGGSRDRCRAGASEGPAARRNMFL